MQKVYNSLLKMKTTSQTLLLNLFQQYKMELYKTKVLNRAVEMRLDKQLNGMLNLLVYRVCKPCQLTRINFFLEDM